MKHARIGGSRCVRFAPARCRCVYTMRHSRRSETDMSESYWKVRIVWWGTSSRMLLQASWNVGGRSQWQQEFVCPDSWDAQEMTGQAAVECLQRLVAWTRTEEGGRWFDDEEHSTAFMLKEAFRLFSNSRFDIKKREVA